MPIHESHGACHLAPHADTPAFQQLTVSATRRHPQSLSAFGTVMRGTGDVPSIAMDPNDRAALVSLLKDTLSRFETVVSAVPPERWLTAPQPGSWSPSEIAEHIIKTELALGPVIRTKLLATDPVEPTSDPHKFDAIMMERIPDRTPGRRRVDAPEWLRPNGAYPTPDAALEAFREARHQTLDFIQTTEAPLRCHKMPHPAFGDIDGCQWLLFIGAHTERHVRQLEQSS